MIVAMNSMGSLGGHSADQLEELVLGDQPVEVFVCPLDHILQVLLGNVSPDVMGDATQVLHTDKPSFFSIEQSEDAIDVLARVSIQESRSHQVNELFEGDTALPLCAQIDC